MYLNHIHIYIYILNIFHSYGYHDTCVLRHMMQKWYIYHLWLRMKTYLLVPLQLKTTDKWSITLRLAQVSVSLEVNSLKVLQENQQ